MLAPDGARDVAFVPHAFEGPEDRDARSAAVLREHEPSVVLGERVACLESCHGVDANVRRQVRPQDRKAYLESAVLRLGVVQVAELDPEIAGKRLRPAVKPDRQTKIPFVARTSEITVANSPTTLRSAGAATHRYAVTLATILQRVLRTRPDAHV